MPDAHPEQQLQAHNADWTRAKDKHCSCGYDHAKLIQAGAEFERAQTVEYLRRDGACDCEPTMRCMSCQLAEEIEKGWHHVV